MRWPIPSYLNRYSQAGSCLRTVERGSGPLVVTKRTGVMQPATNQQIPTAVRDAKGPNQSRSIRRYQSMFVLVQGDAPLRSFTNRLRKSSVAWKAVIQRRLS